VRLAGRRNAATRGGAETATASGPKTHNPLLGLVVFEWKERQRLASKHNDGEDFGREGFRDVEDYMHSSAWPFLRNAFNAAPPTGRGPILF
jgi:hypothetical protein